MKPAEAADRAYEKDFRPELSPKHMLKLGVFGGAYFGDDYEEYPSDWFTGAKLSADGTYRKDQNFFGVMASQPLRVWQAKGWISKHDPRGWFQWYCRYTLGRRIPEEDARQIKRWKAIRRHIAQLKTNCLPGDLSCRPVQRQALLHWAYDSRKL